MTGKLYYHPNNHVRPLEVYIKIHAYGHDNVMELIIGFVENGTNTITDDTLTFKENLIDIDDLDFELDILYTEKQKDKDDHSKS